MLNDPMIRECYLIIDNAETNQESDLKEEFSEDLEILGQDSLSSYILERTVKLKTP
jgi:hypothetical protein